MPSLEKKMIPGEQHEVFWKRKVEELQKINKELAEKLEKSETRLEKREKRWKEKSEVYRWKNNECLVELDKMNEELKVMKKKEQEYQKMIEKNMVEIEKMRDDMAENERKYQMERKVEVERFQNERRTLHSQMDRTEEHWSSRLHIVCSNFEKEKAEKEKRSAAVILALNNVIAQLKTEIKELKKVHELGFGGCDENDREALVRYLLNYQQELKSQSESADMQWKEFARLNNHQFDSVVAETELMNYLVETDASRKKVNRNLKMLEENPNTALILLHKVRPLPSTVFSDETTKKMEEALKAALEESMTECVICIEVLRNDQRMFTCMHCTNKFHFECYTEWARQAQTCPLCRQATPNSIPHNIVT